MRTIPNSAFSSFFPAVWRYMRHNGCQCRCFPYANRFKADYTTVMLIGNVEECKINPTFFPWSFHVVRFCERRVKFKLASPLYSDHPYNVFGLGRGIWTPDVLVPNQTLYQTEPYLENCAGDCNQTIDKLIIIGQFSKNNSHHVKVCPLWVSWRQELNLQHPHYKWALSFFD